MKRWSTLALGVCAWWLSAGLPAVAAAQSQSPQCGTQAPVLLVIAPTLARLDAVALRLALENELRVPVVSSAALASACPIAGTLVLQALDEASVRLSYAPAITDRDPIARELTLPPEGTDPFPAIVMLAGNLVRDEASTLLPEPSAAAAPTSAADAQRLSRSALLASHLEGMHRRAKTLPWRAGFMLTVGVAGIGAGLFVDRDLLPGAFVGVGAVALVGGLGALLAPEAYAEPFIASTFIGGLGLALLAAGIDARAPVSTLFIPEGIGLLGSSALSVVSSLIRVQVPASRLAHDYERLRDPTLRARLSEAEVSAIEDRYRRMAPALDARLLLTPAFAGQVVAGSLIMTSPERAGTIPRATLGTMILLSVGLEVLLMSVIRVDYERYKSQLNDAHITLSVVPTSSGAALAGQF